MALQPLVTAWGGISQVLCDREKPSGSRTPSSRSWGGENPVRVNTKLIHTPVSAGAEGAGAAQPAGVGSAPLGVGSFSLLGIFRDIKATGSSFSAFFFLFIPYLSGPPQPFGVRRCICNKPFKKRAFSQNTFVTSRLNPRAAEPEVI